jgi:hypothetical protein
VPDEQNYERTNGGADQAGSLIETCDKCGRARHYGVRRLIEQPGRDGKITRQMPDWPD